MLQLGAFATSGGTVRLCQEERLEEESLAQLKVQEESLA
jgi:hypothetical protein